MSKSNSIPTQSPKSPAMEALLQAFTTQFAAVPRAEAFDTQRCVTCGEPVGQFKDELSRKEYSLSGMCQTCQDEVFDF